MKEIIEILQTKCSKYSKEQINEELFVALAKEAIREYNAMNTNAENSLDALHHIIDEDMTEKQKAIQYAVSAVDDFFATINKDFDMEIGRGYRFSIGPDKKVVVDLSFTPRHLMPSIPDSSSSKE